MNQRELLTDVSLSELTLNGNGPDVSLTFLSMKNGHQVGRIFCHGLLVMNCVCSALPLVVCEVRLEECEVSDSALRLEQLGYGLAPHVHKFLPSNTKTINFITLEGEDVIQIACLQVVICRSE
jgi:hypothetical protein